MSMLLITFGEFGTFYDSFENGEDPDNPGNLMYDPNVYTSSKETIAKVRLFPYFFRWILFFNILGLYVVQLPRISAQARYQHGL